MNFVKLLEFSKSLVIRTQKFKISSKWIPKICKIQRISGISQNVILKICYQVPKICF